MCIDQEKTHILKQGSMEKCKTKGQVEKKRKKERRKNIKKKNRVPVVTQERVNKKKSESQPKTTE